MINVILYAYYDVFVNNNSAISVVCFFFHRISNLYSYLIVINVYFRCSRGFIGERCERRCDCLNGGECLIAASIPKCICPIGK
uniref:EGF-like domain-containing protein n=1 Tax=Ascaris lumbricoides TaxID=6252 RepID=A0A0M3IVE0_ASCLU